MFPLQFKASVITDIRIVRLLIVFGLEIAPLGQLMLQALFNVNLWSMHFLLVSLQIFLT